MTPDRMLVQRALRDSLGAPFVVSASVSGPHGATDPDLGPVTHGGLRALQTVRKHHAPRARMVAA